MGTDADRKTCALLPADGNRKRKADDDDDDEEAASQADKRAKLTHCLFLEQDVVQNATNIGENETLNVFYFPQSAWVRLEDLQTVRPVPEGTKYIWGAFCNVSGMLADTEAALLAYAYGIPKLLTECIPSMPPPLNQIIAGYNSFEVRLLLKRRNKRVASAYDITGMDYQQVIRTIMNQHRVCFGWNSSGLCECTFSERDFVVEAATVISK